MSQPERLGRYSILGLLGSGAMGDVYLAEDPQIERRLAIKTVRLGGRDEDVEERKQRLLREAKAAGKLIHPHVVTLFDYGEDQGVVYLAFEYVEGEDLRHRIDRQPPLTVREALTLTRQTAAALALAHRHSIVHRDIKPANILLTASGDAKVTDFGIAKLRDQASNLTMSGSIIGTPHYMSPEQVKGEPLDGRSDLFSLGSVLFEMLHGSRPFQADSVTTVVYLILHHDPFESRRQDLPQPLVELLARMLAKSHAERFGRCEEVVEAIDRVLSELPANQLAAPATGPSPPAEALLGKTTPLSATQPPMEPPGSPPPTGAGPPSAPPPSGTTPPAAAPSPPPTAPPTVTPPTVSPPGAASPPPSTGAAVPPTGTAVPPAGTMDPAMQPALDTSHARKPRRAPFLILAGCVGLFVVVGAVLLVAFGPRAWSWLQERRASLGEEVGGAVDGAETEATGSEATIPPSTDAPGAGDEIADLESTGADQRMPDVGDAEPATEDEDVDDSTAAPTISTAPPGDRSDRNRSSPPVDVRNPTTRRTPAASTETTSPRSGDDRPTPAATEPEDAAPSTAPAEPTVAEPTPVDTTPAEPPVEVEAAYDAELDTGLRLSLEVEPEDAFVLLRSAFDDRFTSVGQAQDYDASKRRGEPFGLPSDGVHYLMIRAEGFADHVVKLNVDAGRTGITTYSLRMGRPGQRSAAANPTEISVGQGITFSDGPRRAKVEVDGREVGRLRDYQAGKLLRLDPGRHRVVVTDGSTRYELAVEVAAGAASDRKVVTLGSDG